MTYKTDNYNLLEEKWIPVLMNNGMFQRIGIRNALTEAGTIRQIAASNPIDNVALLRLLLAVMQWCKPNLSRRDRTALADSEGIPNEWLRKNLGTEKRPSPLFELMGRTNRFMQASDDARNQRPVADLFHELPGGTNIAHFHHIRDYSVGICFACIAVGLARLPTSITGKGPGKRSGINGDPPLYFVPLGKTLKSTLVLNWPFPIVAGDEPCWTHSSSIGNPDSPVGVLEGFTWTSRQFRIDDQSIQSGSCVVCGEHTCGLVTHLHELNQPNGRQGLSGSELWSDPHVALDHNGKKVHAKETDKSPSTSAGQWRIWLKAMEQDDKTRASPPDSVLQAARRVGDTSFRVAVVGLACRKDKFIEGQETCLTIPGAFFTEGPDNQISSALRQLDNGVGMILNPHATQWSKPVKKLKDARWLRTLADYGGQKMPAQRSALASLLPALERAMFDTVRQVLAGSGVGTGLLQRLVSGWNQAQNTVIESTSTRSLVSRWEAIARAKQTLEREITNLEKSDSDDVRPADKRKRSPHENKER